MKLSLLSLSVAAAGTLGICDLCQSSTTPPAELAVISPRSVGATRAPAAAVDTVTLHIEGMTCGGCTLATRTVLERLDGVRKAEVEYEKKRAVVTFDPVRVTVAQMIAAVATLEYTATVAKP
jgi:copper chaperone CopZ